MKRSAVFKRKLLIQSLERRYALDGTAMGVADEVPHADCEVSIIDSAEGGIWLLGGPLALEEISFHSIDDSGVNDVSVDDVSLEKDIDLKVGETWVGGAQRVSDVEDKNLEVVTSEELFYPLPIEGDWSGEELLWQTFVEDGITDSLVDGAVEIIEATESDPEVIVCFHDDGSQFDESLIYQTLVVLEDSEDGSAEIPNEDSVEEAGDQVDVIVGEDSDVSLVDLPLEMVTTGVGSQENWHQCDVNQDGRVSALDALLIINTLNSATNSGTQAEAAFSAAAPSDSAQIVRQDTSGDGRITALDLLLVVNELNSESSGSNLSETQETQLQGDENRLADLDLYMLDPPADSLGNDDGLIGSGDSSDSGINIPVFPDDFEFFVGEDSPSEETDWAELVDLGLAELL